MLEERPHRLGVQREGRLDRRAHVHNLGDLGVVSEEPFVHDRRALAEDQMLAPVGRFRDGDHPELGRLDGHPGLLPDLVLEILVESAVGFRAWDQGSSSETSLQVGRLARRIRNNEPIEV